MLSCITHPPVLSRKGQTALPGTPEEPDPAGRFCGNTFLRNQLISPSTGSLETAFKPRRRVCQAILACLGQASPLLDAPPPTTHKSTVTFTLVLCDPSELAGKKGGGSPLLMQWGYKEKDGLQPHWASGLRTGAVAAVTGEAALTPPYCCNPGL